MCVFIIILASYKNNFSCCDSCIMLSCHRFQLIDFITCINVKLSFYKFYFKRLIPITNCPVYRSNGPPMIIGPLLIPLKYERAISLPPCNLKWKGNRLKWNSACMCVCSWYILVSWLLSKHICALNLGFINTSSNAKFLKKDTGLFVLDTWLPDIYSLNNSNLLINGTETIKFYRTNTLSLFNGTYSCVRAHTDPSKQNMPIPTYTSTYEYLGLSCFHRGTFYLWKPLTTW